MVTLNPAWPAAVAQEKYGDDVPVYEAGPIDLAAWVVWYGHLKTAPWPRKRIEDHIALCTPPATWRMLHKEARTMVVNGRRVDRGPETALESHRIYLEGRWQWTYATEYQWRAYRNKHERTCRAGNACPTLQLRSLKERAKRFRKLPGGYCITCYRRRARAQKGADHAE